MVGTTGARVHLAVRLLLELGLEGRSIPWHHGLRDARPGEALDGQQQWRLVGGDEA
jgi:hypothetical protein